MNIVKNEGDFLKNGQKSPLHCIEHRWNDAGEYADYHYHKYNEILYGVDCDIKVWVDDKLEEFKTGDVCFINSMETHFMFSDKKNNTYKVIKFYPEILEHGGQSLSEAKYLLPVFYKNGSFNHVIKKEELIQYDTEAIFKNIFKEWELGNTGYGFAIRGEILKLFSRIVRIWEAKYGETSFYMTNDENVKSIHDSISYILENLDAVSEREVAEKVHMSYSYFSRMFKKIVGKSFSQFVNDSRIDEAKRLLLTTSCTLTEISQRVGFSSLSHFIYVFRNVTGTTPNTYKNKFNT